MAHQGARAGRSGGNYDGLAHPAFYSAGVNVEQARLRRHRRFRFVLGITAGVGIGVGLGGLVVFTGTWLLLLVLAIPLAVRIADAASGRRSARDRVDWLYPVIAPFVAVATIALLPQDLAVAAVAFGVVAWFLLVVVGGSIDYLLDPALMERPRG